MSTALSGLFQSRKFMVLLLDTVVAVILYFTGKYATPSASQDINFLIGALQVPVLMIIGSFAYENGQDSKANATVEAAKVAAGATSSEVTQ